MNERPTGLLVPVTTPFDPTTGEVAPVSLRENARYVLRAGASGVVAAGSTGEAALLDDDEFGDVVAWLRDVVDDEHWLIAGTGRESTRATIAACRLAFDRGADAALVRTPAYYAPAITPAGLLDHFRQVADESPIPVLLYNMPKYTHLPITDALLAALAAHENVWGVKDSSGDLKNFAAYRDAVPSWSLYIGSGALFYAALEMGAAGAIAAAGTFASEGLAGIGRSFAIGDRQAAGAAQELLAPLHKTIVAGLGVAGIKVALDAVGLYGGPVRPPLTPLSARDGERVAEALRHASLVSA